LAKAQLILEEAETKLERLRALLAERKAERREVEICVQEIAASGDMDKLVSLGSRAARLDKTIVDLNAAVADQAVRVESARRYLYTLYIRLEKLRQEFAGLMRTLASVEPGEGLPADVQINLGRVKVQLKAITGENSTGRL
jgi:uncharacterized coiled-coil protein SlyX